VGANEGSRRRAVVSGVTVSFSLVVLILAIVLTQTSVGWRDLWHKIAWGTVPEWVIVFAIAPVAVGATRRLLDGSGTRHGHNALNRTAGPER
jgi:hypothetical protein